MNKMANLLLQTKIDETYKFLVGYCFDNFGMIEIFSHGTVVCLWIVKTYSHGFLTAWSFGETCGLHARAALMHL